MDDEENDILKELEELVLERSAFAVEVGRDLVSRAVRDHLGAMPGLGLAWGQWSDLQPVIASEEYRRILKWCADPRANIAFLIDICFDLTCDVAPECLERAVSEWLTRFPILTSVISAEGMILPREFAPANQVLTLCKDEGEWHALCNVEMSRPWDLAQEFPCKVVASCRNNTVESVCILLHHICCDGHSIRTLLQELFQLLGAPQEGWAASTSAHRPYFDYARWEKAAAESEFMRGLEEYWVAKLLDERRSPLSWTRQRPFRRTFRGEVLAISFSSSLAKRIERAALRCKSTHFAVHLLAIGTAISLACDRHGVLLGVTASNRLIRGFGAVVGPMANTIVIKTPPPSELVANARSTVEDFRREMLLSFSGQAYPFGRLVQKLQPETHPPDHHPLVQVMVDYLDKDEDRWADEFTSVRNMRSRFRRPDSAKYDVSFLIARANDQVNCSLEYSTDLFDRELIQAFADHCMSCYDHVLDALEKGFSS